MEGDNVVEHWFTVAGLKVEGQLVSVRADDGSSTASITFMTSKEYAPKLWDRVVIQWRKPTTTVDELVDAVTKAATDPAVRNRITDALALTTLGVVRVDQVPTPAHMDHWATIDAEIADDSARLADSPRWCAICKAYGDHHTSNCPVVGEAELPSAAEAEFEADLREDDADSNRDEPDLNDVEPF